MKPLVLVLLAAFALPAMAITDYAGNCTTDSKSGSEKGRSIDISGSTWGQQALGNTQHPTMAYCANLISKPLGIEVWSESKHETPDYFPVALDAAICSKSASKSIDLLLAKLNSNGLLPPPDDAVVLKAIAVLPIEQILQEARRVLSFDRERFDEYFDSSSYAWAIKGSPWRFTTENGRVNILRKGSPWFDDDHVEGRKVSYKQSTSSSNSSGDGTSLRCIVGGRK